MLDFLSLDKGRDREGFGTQPGKQRGIWNTAKIPPLDKEGVKGRFGTQPGKQRRI